MSYIHSHFRSFRVEDGFSEEDVLWRPDRRETEDEQVIRVKRLLDDVFTHDQETFISFTSHSGNIAAILKAIGHRPFALQTGGLIPVLVRAEFYR